MLDKEGWGGRVASLSRSLGGGEGLERCSPDGDACSSLDEGDEVPAGSLLRTDGQTRARLELVDGTELVLDRATRIVLRADGGRRAKLLDGSLIADVAKIEDRPVALDVPLGSIEVLGTKFSVRVYDEAVAVDVSRGRVRASDRQERSVVVGAGESGRLYPDRPPAVTSIASFGESLAWSDETFRGEPDERDGPRAR